MIRALALALLLAGPALAEAPVTSELPKPRPGLVTVPATAPVTAADPLAEVEPKPRPLKVVEAASFTPVNLPSGPLRSPVPKPRPDDLVTIASASAADPDPVEDEVEPKPKPKKGKGLCKDPRLKGELLESFGDPTGCGITDPVRLREVDGVKLSTPATIDCETAGALADWIEDVAKPAFRRTGGGLDRLEIYASYACRKRNNLSSGKLSEHAKGNAVDIGGFVLANGQVVSVLSDWGKGTAGRILKDIRRGACGIFRTVLGPGSDRYHANHFHFDTARYRSGAYCK
jgi:hypothetical protein